MCQNRLADQVDQAVERYISIAQKYRIDVCQMAIAFTIRNSLYTSTIIGATNMEQLKNNISSIDIK